MMMIRALLITVSLVLSLPSLAAACDWGYIASSKLYEQAAAVFVGKVVESPWPLQGATSALADQNRVVFEVEKAYKGSLPRRITMTPSTSCAYPFQRGETYLVHADLIDGRLDTRQSLRPLPVAQAAEELKYVEAAMLGRPPAILTVVTGIDADLAGNLTVVLRGPNGKTETQRPWRYEMMLPPGDYTIWLEVSGKLISERKGIRLNPGEATSSVFQTTPIPQLQGPSSR